MGCILAEKPSGLTIEEDKNKKATLDISGVSRACPAQPAATAATAAS
jgi:hypothetical protein